MVATPVAAALGMAAVLALWARTGGEILSTSAFVAFPIFVAIGDLLEIPLERRSVFSLGLAPALAFAFLGPDAPHIGEVAIVFLIGTMLTTVLRLARGRDLRLHGLAARLLVVMAATAAFQGISSVAPEAFAFSPNRMSALGLAGALVVVLALDTALHAFMVVAERRLSIRQSLRDQIRATGLLLTSTVSVGSLLALAYPALNTWTLPLFLAPLAATHYSFKQVVTMRKNYLQTVGALSRVPEMAGYTVRGHSSRVARLSVEIATELGMGESELHEIEYGALLHDIGRISLPDPEEAPANTAALELALVGAEIVEKTGHFSLVAEMVRHQNEPYRRRGEEANRGLPEGAKIIKVASAYDDLTEPPGPGRSAWDALERLHLGMAYDYDPKVIQALTRVLEKRGLI